MTLKLAALSLALSVGATLVYAQDTIDPKTGKKRGPMEVWRDRDRPNKAPTATPTPSRNPPRDISRIHDHDRDRDDRYRVARHRQLERHERLERERRERFERERRERRERLERSRANQPPGWSKGKKTGWDNCDVPPGQAKKYGCHPGYRGHSHHKERG